jgi:GT2 family glycosyltransferase
MSAVTTAASPATALAAAELPFPTDMDLTVRGRNPLRLSDATVQTALNSTIPTTRCAAQPDGAVDASILVVTHNNLVLTRLCLHALLAHTGDDCRYELLVIDNASTDGTVDYLHQVAAAHAHVRVIANSTNLGFAAANNQGLAAARGRVLVLLNNDTIVPPRWLDGLARHVADPSVGTVCATTNRIGNEAEIDVTYRTFGEFRAFAATRIEEHRGCRLEIPMAAMFCHAMTRETYERVGQLDEQFAVGMFEDDDYAMRVRAAGLKVTCAEDVFVHHFGGASFGNLIAGGEHGRIFRANRRRFEQKWGVTWQGHARRDRSAYERVNEQLRHAVRSSVPADSIIAVVSKGDEQLVDLGDELLGWHFPRGADGGYAGHYPADCAEATAHLESLRAAGAQYLLLPSSATWWLEHYPDFARHLYARYACERGDELDYRLFHLDSLVGPDVDGGKP